MHAALRGQRHPGGRSAGALAGGALPPFREVRAGAARRGRMSLRAKIIAYLVLIHAVLAAISVLVLRENRLWLLAVEALFVLSVVLGALLVRAFFIPLELIRTGAELIGERDFTTQFRE